MNLPHLIHLFEYNAWANARALQTVVACPSERSGELMSHIVETEYLWYLRIRGGYESMVSVWNRWPVDRLEKEIELLPATWSAWMGELADADLERSVTYTNTKGVVYTNSVRQILVHVIHHSTYHRGQVAAEVRRTGGTPALTDYIAYFR